jgi:hypothetical protein
MHSKRVQNCYAIANKRVKERLVCSCFFSQGLMMVKFPAGSRRIMVLALGMLITSW